MAATKRSSDEIRASIETEREALSQALTTLRLEVTDLVDWRKQLGRHRNELLAGVAALSALAAVYGVLRRLFSGD